MIGLVPSRSQWVRQAFYQVKQGDSVDSIAGSLSGSPNRWPELVGANRHKRLATLPGERWKAFSNLEEGELLYIPGDFSSGALGDVDLIPPSLAAHFATITEVPSTAQIASAWAAVKDAALEHVTGGQGGWPPEVQIFDAAKVVSAWIPYLSSTVQLPPIDWFKNPVNVLGPFPGITVPPSTIRGLQNLGQLMLSASQFVLRSGGADPASVPWDRVPWQTFPWTSFRTGISWVSLLAREWLPSSPTGPSTAPDFRTIKWTAAPFADVNWSEITWSDQLAEWMKDPRATCISEPNTAAARLEKMSEYQNYWTDADVFFDCYCADYEVAKCIESPQKPPVRIKPPAVDVSETSDSTGTIVMVVLGVTLAGVIVYAISS